MIQKSILVAMLLVAMFALQASNLQPSKPYNIALDIAVLNNNAEEIRRLIETGEADVNQRDIYEMTPLYKAVINHHNNQMIECLHSLGADLNVRDQDSSTPLWHAAHKKRILALNILIGLGADPNIAGMYGTTPLMEVMHQQDIQSKATLDALLQGGANPNQHDDWVDTPLSIAVGRGRREIVRAFHKHGNQDSGF